MSGHEGGEPKPKPKDDQVDGGDKPKGDKAKGGSGRKTRRVGQNNREETELITVYSQNEG